MGIIHGKAPFPLNGTDHRRQVSEITFGSGLLTEQDAEAEKEEERNAHTGSIMQRSAGCAGKAGGGLRTGFFDSGTPVPPDSLIDCSRTARDNHTRLSSARKEPNMSRSLPLLALATALGLVQFQ